MKPMPHSLEAEANVIGSMIIDNKLIDEVKLKSTDFYSKQNEIIFETIVEVNAKGQAVDVITLLESLRNKNKEINPMEIAKIADSLISTSNINEYCEIVKENSNKRFLIRELEQLRNECYLKPSGDSLANVQKLAYDLSLSKQAKEFEQLPSVIERTFKELNEIYKNPTAVTGLSTGFKSFDDLTAGLQKGDLILMAGRPSMGKTALAINIAQNVAYRENKVVAVFSLEMSSEQLGVRILSSESRTSSLKIKVGKQSQSEWERVSNTIVNTKNKDVKMFLDDTSGITPSEVRNKCRKLKATKGLDLIIIDYLQLMNASSKNESRQHEISSISRELKGIARELECPLIALSQLSRAPEARTNKRPMLSDLRDSGAIEQDADLVCMLYRDRYYNPYSEDDTTEVIVAKNRNGETKTIKFKFRGEFTTFIPHYE